MIEIKDVRSVAIDTIDMSYTHPTTFNRPNDAKLDALMPLQAVKIGVGGERFWVWLQSIDKTNQTYIGVIDNDLVRSEVHGLHCGDPVLFERRHIIAIDPPCESCNKITKPAHH